MNRTAISVQSAVDLINQSSGSGRLWLAFSGGVDSTVLLHLLAQAHKSLARELIGVHINHQLSPNAAEWARHCLSVCASHSIRCEVITLDANKIKGASPEAYARDMRYAALRQLVQKDDQLLMAHHLDDQAETLLLQLLRGSGPDGLAAMPAIKPFGPGWLVRPLLNYSRQQLQDYAEAHGLHWIEDESNDDINIQRNFIRHEVLPLIRQCWPSADMTLSRVAGHQAEAGHLLREIAIQDFGSHPETAPEQLGIKQINGLSSARMKNLLRYWCRMNGHPAPSTVVLEKIIHELIYARQDANPCVKWAGCEIRRYRDSLYIMSSSESAETQHVLQWDLHQPLELKAGRLEAQLVTGQGIKSSAVPDAVLAVHFRAGGEKLKPAGRKETHTLKNLFQEAGLPPWLRDQVPLLYVNDQLAGVAGWWIDEAFQAGAGEPGWLINLSADFYERSE